MWTLGPVGDRRQHLLGLLQRVRLAAGHLDTRGLHRDQVDARDGEVDPEPLIRGRDQDGRGAAGRDDGDTAAIQLHGLPGCGRRCCLGRLRRAHPEGAGARAVDVDTVARLEPGRHALEGERHGDHGLGEQIVGPEHIAVRHGVREVFAGGIGGQDGEVVRPLCDGHLAHQGSRYARAGTRVLTHRPGRDVPAADAQGGEDNRAHGGE